MGIEKVNGLLMFRNYKDCLHSTRYAASLAVVHLFVLVCFTSCGSNMSEIPGASSILKSTSMPGSSGPTGGHRSTTHAAKHKGLIVKKQVELEVSTYTTDGFEAAKAKDMNKAIDLFQRAIETKEQLPPDDELAQLHANLGWGYMGMENWKQAEKEYAKALAIASPKCAARKFFARDKAFNHSQMVAQQKKK
jgi:hypothetical protein